MFPVGNAGSAGATPPLPRNPLLQGVMQNVRLLNIENGPGFSRCQLFGVPGDFEKRTHGDAIGYAHAVMQLAAAATSGGDAKALNRTLQLLGTSTVDNLGPVLLAHLTAIGALRAGVAALLDTATGSRRTELTHLLASVDAAITRTGVKAGKCKRPAPDAVYIGSCPSSKKVCEAVEAAERVMLGCAAKIGGQELLAGVAQAMLPRAMRESVAARLPNALSGFLQPGGTPNLENVLKSDAASFVERALRMQLERGSAGDLEMAIFDVLRIPEYVQSHMT